MLLFVYEREGVAKIPLERLVSDFRKWRTALHKLRLTTASKDVVSFTAQFSLPFTSSWSMPDNGDEAAFHRKYEFQTNEQAEEEGALLMFRFESLLDDEKLELQARDVTLALVDKNSKRYDLHLRATLSGAGLLKEQS